MSQTKTECRECNPHGFPEGSGLLRYTDEGDPNACARCGGRGWITETSVDPDPEPEEDLGIPYPCGDRVVVELPVEEDWRSRPSGIVTREREQPGDMTVCTLVSTPNPNGPIRDLRFGEKVLISRYAGVTYAKDDGTRYVIVKEDEIIARFQPKKARKHG